MRQLVREAMARALANGYTFSGMTPMQIAIDMRDCDAGIEDATECAEVLVPYIERELEERKLAGT